MSISLLLQFAICSLVATGAIYVIINTLTRMGIKNQQIPLFWISIILGFIMALPNVILTFLNIAKVTPPIHLSMVFSYLTISLFFFIPLLTMLRPFSFSLSAARLEVPLLFSICVVYFLYGVDGQPFSLKKIIPLIIIFLIFCYDIMRMLELGDYKLETKVKESKAKNFLTLIGFSLIFAIPDLVYVLNIDAFAVKTSYTFFEILLLLSAIFLMLLPHICIVVTWLKNNAPSELLISSIMFCYIFTATLLIPLIGLYIPMFCSEDLIFYSFTSIIGLGILWFQITVLHHASRIIATILLASFLFLLYSSF
ncbi:MAG: hypothetical protein MJ048_01730 [Acidaminococcaceae bacterium]|nr:hypothetical protein [Acidaminococcaceae bacterium]